MLTSDSADAVAQQHHDALFSPSVRSLRDDPNYVKCPRCWHMHTVLLNHDKLCDRCCDALVTGWPEHASVPFILANREAQRRHFSRPNTLENYHAHS